MPTRLSVDANGLLEANIKAILKEEGCSKATLLHNALMFYVTQAPRLKEKPPTSPTDNPFELPPRLSAVS